jgi:hypothetical protein
VRVDNDADYVRPTEVAAVIEEAASQCSAKMKWKKEDIIRELECELPKRNEAYPR